MQSWSIRCYSRKNTTCEISPATTWSEEAAKTTIVTITTATVIICGQNNVVRVQTFPRIQTERNTFTQRRQVTQTLGVEKNKLETSRSAENCPDKRKTSTHCCPCIESTEFVLVLERCQCLQGMRINFWHGFCVRTAQKDSTTLAKDQVVSFEVVHDKRHLTEIFL